MHRYMDAHGPPPRWSRALALAVAALASGVLAAGCGGGSSSSTAGASSAPPKLSESGASSTAAGRSARAPSTAGASVTGATGALAFAECMRANGVPDFPDPSPGGGFEFNRSAGVDPASPAVREARVRCQRFAPQPPGVGPSGFSPQQRAHALAQLRGVAVCMRRHGISDFPDPLMNRPPNASLGQYSEITDYQGVFLLFPASIDVQSPAWQQAAAACGSLAESFNHPHH